VEAGPEIDAHRGLPQHAPKLRLVFAIIYLLGLCGNSEAPVESERAIWGEHASVKDRLPRAP
jgi:hypothetical protein